MSKFKHYKNLLYSKTILILKSSIRLLTRIFLNINRKKRYAIPFYGIMGYILFVILLINISGDELFDKVIADKRVNDVTQINSIQVAKVVTPHTIQDIVKAIQSTTGKISIGGGRFSMGGQIGYQNSLHIDMRQFNKVLNLDKGKKQVTVQAGITWRDLQKVIDKEDLSVKIMQTYANFTVGGSISVNCHGRYIGHGPIISSILELKIVSASGEIITASRKENKEIFKSAIGGYGGIGVIAEATLQLVENEKVERETKLIEVADYNEFFEKNIKNDSNVVFQNGDLYPPNYDVINNVSWKKTHKDLTDTTRITPENVNYWLETKLVEFVSWGDFGKWIRRIIIDPFIYNSEKIVWRNKEASYDVKELEPKSRENETYVLQEYFIPVNNIQSFIPKMKAIYDKYDVNIINVSLRHAYPDKESFLSWANQEVFAFVVYYKQGTDKESKKTVKRWTQEITNAIISVNGTWYLPYQPHATLEQFKKGYPKSEKYFEIKNKLDPSHRFTNRLLDKYNPFIQTRIEKERENIKGYFRAEEQTILTIPEWYLVFNPKEYADYLESEKDPSDFPFFSSIDEYWKLYDRSMKLVSIAYPKNEEYNTMLMVIGISVTMEYALKIIYENTFGEIFSWFANDSSSEQEKVIAAAHRAYSDFIYNTAWYEFEFMPWIKKVWSVSDTSKSSWLRKWERTVFFTSEFTIKACYALLIEWAAKTNYEEPITDIYLLVSGKNEVIPTQNIKIIKTQDDKNLISVSRWGIFTQSILELSSKDITIQEIGGNDEIAISLLIENNRNINFDNVELLYESKVVTNNKLKRLVCLLPVNELVIFVRFAKENSIVVEHIYDF